MILLTGATGYIGSHLWVEFLRNSIPVIGLDNLSNSNIGRLEAIAEISGVSPIFIQGDIRDMDLLNSIFSKHQITSVIHLAALKNIQESMHYEEEYFDVNVNGLRQLIKAMRAHSCLKIIFSSSAAIYGECATSPIKEISTPMPSNYYGFTKLQGEKLLSEEFHKLPPMNSVSLRYFNVSGWHGSGLLYEANPQRGQSLFSEVKKVLNGDLTSLPIYGDDWDTPDGTCIRDYLHVSDLVNGHIHALKLNGVCKAINLGSGEGRSVQEVVSECGKQAGVSIPTTIESRRVGDIAISYADISLAMQEMGWRPLKTLTDICRDSCKKRKKVNATSQSFSD